MSDRPGRSLLLNEQDNVAVALEGFAPGTDALLAFSDGRRRVHVTEKIPAGHKFSIADIPAGGPILKYGEIIGLATRDIPSGSLVHVHNVASQRGRGDLNAPGVG